MTITTIILKLAILSLARTAVGSQHLGPHIGDRTRQSGIHANTARVGRGTIPEFMYDKEQGLMFDFVPLNHGPGGCMKSDICLEVKLTVLRESGYYDNNIIPLVALLNLVAISTLFLEPHRFLSTSIADIEHCLCRDWNSYDD